MRRLLSVLAISVIATAPCAAQSFDCNGEAPVAPLSPAVIKFTPAAPSASQTIAIAVGVTRYIGPQGAVATLQGSSINVTLTATLIGFTPPPRSCVMTSIGPLPAGTYAVNLFVNDLNGSVPSPNLVATTLLTVAPASDPAIVPALSGVALAALALLLSIAGRIALRRRSN